MRYLDSAPQVSERRVTARRLPRVVLPHHSQTTQISAPYRIEETIGIQTDDPISLDGAGLASRLHGMWLEDCFDMLIEWLYPPTCSLSTNPSCDAMSLRCVLLVAANLRRAASTVKPYQRRTTWKSINGLDMYLRPTAHID